MALICVFIYIMLLLCWPCNEIRIKQFITILAQTDSGALDDRVLYGYIRWLNITRIAELR